MNLKLSMTLSAVALLSGCNQVALPDMMSTGSVFGAVKAPAFEHTITEKRPVQEAFLKLPQGTGKVIDLTETRYANGVEQVITYQGDYDTKGENAARVRILAGSSWMQPNGPKLDVAAPTEAALASELRKAFPGVRMKVSNTINRNAYGPFGYALGRGYSKTICLYGWQHLQGQGTSAAYQLPIFNRASKKPELSVRLRVCKQGVSARDMVSLMKRLRIDADPTQLVRRNSVAWGSSAEIGQANLSGEYDPGGYVSNQIEAAPEPVARPARKRVKKTVRRKATSAPRTTPRRVTAQTQRKVSYAPVPVPSVTTTQVQPATVVMPSVTTAPQAVSKVVPQVTSVQPIYRAPAVPAPAVQTSLVTPVRPGVRAVKPVVHNQPANGFPTIPLPE